MAVKRLWQWVGLAALCVVALEGCDQKSNGMNVQQLVKLYRQYAGSDDEAGQRLKSMGTPARDELIRMLDGAKTPELDVGAIIEILHIYFPCDESYRAIDRYASRIPDPKEREDFQKIWMRVRADDPRKH